MGRLMQTDPDKLSDSATARSAPAGSSSAVQTAYDRWSAVYDTTANRTRDLSASTLRQQALDLADLSVLEIGCGTGLNTLWLAERVEHVVAMDISDGMLAHARRRVQSPRVQFITADLTTRWPCAQQSFDLIVANLVLEHIRDVRHVFAEASRVLRPAGRFYLSELHPDKQLQGSQARYFDPQRQQEVRVPAFPHTISEFTNHAVAAGFTLQHMQGESATGDPIPRLVVMLFHKG